ncbi:MAG TPA: hypothetical protein PKH83_04390 [Cyclobacteriaceae bacterium]|nr:hypothetical protein [Cyclobacteriaceae bacterium]HNU41708.1 hypothetical protein [Cyclobacteriaceae bacterium]
MIALHVLILVSLMYVFARRIERTEKGLFWTAWLYRLLMGVSLGLVYTYYYDANDTWHFFEDAVKLSNLARTNFSEYVQFLLANQPDPEILQTLFSAQERSLFLVKSISLLALISGDNYWTCTIYIATLAFGASWYFFKTISTWFEHSKLAAALSFLFFPSVVFWSSGLVKETLALAGIMVIGAVFIEFMKGDKITVLHVLLCLVAGWVSWNLKYYWTALFIAVILTSLVVFLLGKKIDLLKTYWPLTWSLTFIGIGLVATRLHPNFYLDRLLEVIISNHNAFVKISKPETLIQFSNLRPDWWSIVMHAPFAIVSGLFRPWLGEANGLTGFMAALENLALTILLIGAFFRKTWKTTDGLLVTAVVVYVLMECVLMAISSPNLGTLSRYRVGFLPFFVFVISYKNPLIEKIRLLTWHRHK